MQKDKVRLKARPVPENWEVKERWKWRVAFTTMLLIGLFSVVLGAYLGRQLWPIKPSKLTPMEAAKILHTDKGFAGYSLIDSNAGEDRTLRHAIFCQNCGTPIADVNVVFLQQEKPLPGSKLATLLDYTKYATEAIAAQNRPKKRVEPHVEVIKPIALNK